MDKNAIKRFAVWARTELIARVSLKGVEYGITEGNIEDANVDSVGGKVLTINEKKQRQALIAEINDKGYKQVMEEVAYTWFNRFSALRFMEVNGYLPSHVRVFTDEENNFKPQIITEAIHLNLDGLNIEKVYELKDAEKTEELYKYLLIVQCNALNKILPGMFQKIADYTELLLPDNLLRENTVQSECEDYPSACFLLDSCFQDYQRIQDNYNKIYEKINIALAFSGVILTIMLGAFDFSPAKFNVSNMKIWEVILTSIELMCLGGSLIVIVGATIYLLFLLRGRRIAVFKSEDIRNEEIYRNKESHAALWLIDKYTRIVNEVRPIVQKKQKAFDNAMVAIIVGIMMYVVAVLLRKGGF